MVEETGVPGENYWPAASHWQTFSHNFVSSALRLSGIRTRNAYKKNENFLKDDITYCIYNSKTNDVLSEVKIEDSMYVIQDMDMVYNVTSPKFSDLYIPNR